MTGPALAGLAEAVRLLSRRLRQVARLERRPQSGHTLYRESADVVEAGRLLRKWIPRGESVPHGPARVQWSPVDVDAGYATAGAEACAIHALAVGQALDEEDPALRVLLLVVCEELLALAMRMEERRAGCREAVAEEVAAG